MKKISYNYDKQHAKGKLHAFERIEMLTDSKSFCEIGGAITEYASTCSSPNVPYDGVITGYGKINGKLVYVYSQDFSICGGTVGLNHAKKISDVIKRAIESKCPVIGISDSGGARIQEGVNALAGYGNIFYMNTLASGYIPQISIIAGPCAGGAVYSPGITDFIFMIDCISNMFVTGPKVISQVTGEKCTSEELGGTAIHAQESGVAHCVFKTEEDCFKSVRKLIGYLPSSCQSPIQINTSFLDKKVTDMSRIVPKESRKVYDIKKVIKEIVDRESFFELQEQFAQNIIIGFAKICDIVVGIVANQPNVAGGILDCNSSDKAARFIRFCDSYNIPIITLVDTPGYMPSIKQERAGIIRHGAKILYAYSEATTIKISVILRKAYGGAYIAMCSKQLHADFAYAWPGAEIAVMGAAGAVEVLYQKQIMELDGDSRKNFVNEKILEYTDKFINSDYALREGYIDSEIEPKLTRKVLYDSIVSLKEKKPYQRVIKKHGNIPL